MSRQRATIHEVVTIDTDRGRDLDSPVIFSPCQEPCVNIRRKRFHPSLQLCERFGACLCEHNCRAIFVADKAVKSPVQANRNLASRRPKNTPLLEPTQLKVARKRNPASALLRVR